MGTHGRTSLGLLKHAEQYLTYPKGALIFREGDRGGVMYIVRKGNVQLQVHNLPVETLEPGDFLGEMALVDDEPRSATAVAASDCQVVPIDRDKFLYMVKETPFAALEVMHVMAQRLRKMNRATAILTK